MVSVKATVTGYDATPVLASAIWLTSLTDPDAADVPATVDAWVVAVVPPPVVPPAAPPPPPKRAANPPPPPPPNPPNPPRPVAVAVVRTRDAAWPTLILPMSVSHQKAELDRVAGGADQLDLRGARAAAAAGAPAGAQYVEEPSVPGRATRAAARAGGLRGPCAARGELLAPREVDGGHGAVEVGDELGAGEGRLGLGELVLGRGEGGVVGVEAARPSRRPRGPDSVAWAAAARSAWAAATPGPQVGQESMIVAST